MPWNKFAVKLPDASLIAAVFAIAEAFGVYTVPLNFKALAVVALPCKFVA